MKLGVIDISFALRDLAVQVAQIEIMLRTLAGQVELLASADAPLVTSPIAVNLATAVPYRSQWDDDGSDFASDCGPACVAMVIEHAGVFVGINQLAAEAGMVKGRPYTLPDELIRAAGLHGVVLARRLYCTLPMLSDEINAGRLVIVLIHYGSITSRQDRNYVKGHWVVVVGLDDVSVFIHDPDWKEPYRETGRAMRVPRGMFELAWSECKSDGNTPNQCLMVMPHG